MGARVVSETEGIHSSLYIVDGIFMAWRGRKGKGKGKGGGGGARVDIQSMSMKSNLLAWDGTKKSWFFYFYFYLLE